MHGWPVHAFPSHRQPPARPHAVESNALGLHSPPGTLSNDAHVLRASPAAALYNDLHVVQNLEVRCRAFSHICCRNPHLRPPRHDPPLQACACGAALHRSGVLSGFDEEERKVLRRMRISLTMVRWLSSVGCGV